MGRATCRTKRRARARRVARNLFRSTTKFLVALRDFIAAKKKAFWNRKQETPRLVNKRGALVELVVQEIRFLNCLIRHDRNLCYLPVLLPLVPVLPLPAPVFPALVSVPLELAPPLVPAPLALAPVVPVPVLPVPVPAPAAAAAFDVGSLVLPLWPTPGVPVLPDDPAV